MSNFDNFIEFFKSTLDNVQQIEPTRYSSVVTSHNKIEAYIKLDYDDDCVCLTSQALNEDYDQISFEEDQFDDFKAAVLQNKQVQKQLNQNGYLRSSLVCNNSQHAFVQIVHVQDNDYKVLINDDQLVCKLLVGNTLKYDCFKFLHHNDVVKIVDIYIDQHDNVYVDAQSLALVL